MTTNKPAHTIRLGCIKAAIWANESQDSGTWFTVTVCRIYKDGDAWKQSDSFSRDDLTVVAKALDWAHTWIFENSRRKEEPPA